MIRTPAFDRARELACASGALLHIVAFDYVQALALAGLFDHDAMAQAREGYLQVHRHWLEQQARFQRCIGLQVTTEVVWAKSTLANMLDYVNDFHADMVIKDTHMYRHSTARSIGLWTGCCCVTVRLLCIW